MKVDVREIMVGRLSVITSKMPNINSLICKKYFIYIYI